MPFCGRASLTGASRNRAVFWPAEDGMPSKQLPLCAVRRDQASLIAKHPRHCGTGSGCTKHGIPGLQGLYLNEGGKTLVCSAPCTYPCTSKTKRRACPEPQTLTRLRKLGHKHTRPCHKQMVAYAAEKARRAAR